MSYQNMTQAQYDEALRALGPEEMAKLVATFGTRVNGMPAPQVTQPLAAAMPPQPMANNMQNTGGLTMATAQPQMPQGDLSARVQAYEADALRATEDRFARQREAIEKMYGGPSTSDTLFALSRALLAPRQFTGFGGTMGKIAGAFGDISQERQSAERKRAEALLNLENSYGDKTMGMRGENLDREIKMAEFQAKQEAAARKAAEPKYDIDPLTGKYMMRPGTGTHLGMLTPEQYAMAKADPANRGKRFIGADGVEREIP
jgi:hypothetical protein